MPCTGAELVYVPQNLRAAAAAAASLTLLLSTLKHACLHAGEDLAHGSNELEEAMPDNAPQKKQRFTGAGPKSHKSVCS
jgi:hypothetical protein